MRPRSSQPKPFGPPFLWARSARTRPQLSLVLLMSGLLLLSACSRTEPGAKPISGPPQVGSLYSCSDGEGGYRVAKVLAVEDDIAFVRLFSERWTHRPALDEAHKATAPIPIAYLLTTLSGLRPVHLEDGQASPEELALFEEWKRGKQDVF
jgi:hypothetical protein